MNWCRFSPLGVSVEGDCTAGVCFSPYFLPGDLPGDLAECIPPLWLSLGGSSSSVILGLGLYSFLGLLETSFILERSQKEELFSCVTAHLWPQQAGGSIPVLHLAGQLLQDFGGSAVVLQLSLDQRCQLAHLLDLQHTQACLSAASHACWAWPPPPGKQAPVFILWMRF